MRAQVSALTRRARRAAPVPLVLAALVLAGCGLLVRQIVMVARPHLSQVSSSGRLTTVASFDLNTVQEWRDHQGEIRAITDMALVGRFNHIADPALPDTTDAVVEIWMAPPGTAADPESVRAAGMRIWGPLTLAPGENKLLDWDQGAGLLAPGRAALKSELEGDGFFTLYAITLNPPGSPSYVEISSFELLATLHVKD